MNELFEEKPVISYLLGRSSEAEQTVIEERYFRDDEFYTLVREIEDGLIEDYLRGELSAEDREQFERRILASPHRRRKVERARALYRALAETPALNPEVIATQTHEKASRGQLLVDFFRAQSFVFRVSMAAGLVLVVGLSWMAFDNRRLIAELEESRAMQKASGAREQEIEKQLARSREQADGLAGELEREREQSDELLKERDRLEKERARSEPSAVAVVSFVLSPGLVRGTDEPARISVPQRARLMQLQLDLEGDHRYETYRAELRTAGGTLVWSRDELPTRRMSWGKAVSVNLPAGVLGNGEYEMTLRGISGKQQVEDVGYYYFIVAKR